MQLLLGHSKFDSTVSYFGIEVDDAIDIAEKIDILDTEAGPLIADVFGELENAADHISLVVGFWDRAATAAWARDGEPTSAADPARQLAPSSAPRGYRVAVRVRTMNALNAARTFDVPIEFIA